MMWCRVKYTLDGKILSKSIRDFKDYETITSELKKSIIREEYGVFWSPVEGETAACLEERNERIHDIDATIFSQEEVPVAGYYKAVLHNFAG